MAKTADLTKQTPEELVALIGGLKEQLEAAQKAKETALEDLKQANTDKAELETLVETLNGLIQQKEKFGNKPVITHSDGRKFLAIHGVYQNPNKNGVTIKAADLANNQELIDVLVDMCHGGLKKITN